MISVAFVRTGGNRVFSSQGGVWDSHSDFSPQFKSQPDLDVVESIKKDISNHDVFVFMKVRMLTMKLDCMKRI